VAGAGSGKTRVVEYRALNLVLHHIDPRSILLLTFTRKAARTMLSRASQHDARCAEIEGGTFHSFAFKILEKYHRQIGFAQNFSFLDEQDAQDVLNLLSERLGFLEDKERFPRKDTLRQLISASFNRNLYIENILEKDYPHFLHLAEKIKNLRQEFVKYKLGKNLVDYDDMLLYLKAMLKQEALNQKIASRYRYIMVDEFQDTNKIQAEIVYLLGKNHKNVMAVGDDTQSIYSFRGAHHKNMFEFPKLFSGTKIITLQTNYRSRQPILDLANALIEEAKEKYTKILQAEKTGGEKPGLFFFQNREDEAEWVAGQIKSLRDETGELAEIAVLFRSNYLSALLQLELAKRNIPFVVYGGMRFIETAHVKDILAHLRAILNPQDELAWKRCLMLIEKVGPRTAEKIYTEIMSKKNFLDQLGKFSQGKPYLQKLKPLAKLFSKLRSEKKTAAEQVKETIHYYSPLMKNLFDDYHRRQDDLRALAEIASRYNSLRKFIADFVTIEPPEKSISSLAGKKQDEAPVVLSTIHSAKGLEWENVFIISLVDGCLPVSYALEDEQDLEEERRLFYVAITRAKDRLYLSLHHEGVNNGIATFNRLSRFLNHENVLNKLANFSQQTQAGFSEEEALNLEFKHQPFLDKKLLLDEILSQPFD
jgi:DNA helicase-2/ATP-dependent DNA helicase PcrA